VKTARSSEELQLVFDPQCAQGSKADCSKKNQPLDQRLDQRINREKSAMRDEAAALNAQLNIGFL